MTNPIRTKTIRRLAYEHQCKVLQESKNQPVDLHELKLHHETSEVLMTLLKQREESRG